MKTDTEYFHIAVDTWCKAHKLERDLPCTPSWMSQMLRDAQALKTADRAKLESETTSSSFNPTVMTSDSK